jgi:predicted DsbA family dithiol-disulfide isomerase
MGTRGAAHLANAARPAGARRALRIDVEFDFVCPWCLIGLRNLQSALAELRAGGQAAPEVHWRGVQLLPQAPPAGWPFHAFYLERLGGSEALRQRQAQVLAAAEAAGARIDYARIATMPNTADAHRLLEYAAQAGTPAQRDALLERLFGAYFEHGEDLGDAAVLLAHGQACGFEREPLTRLMRGAAAPFHGAGTGGVPLFTFDGWLQLGGARPPAALLDAMRTALAAAV